MKINPINIQRNNTVQNFGQSKFDTNTENSPLSKKQKLGILATSVAGVGIASAFIASGAFGKVTAKGIPPVREIWFKYISIAKG